MLWLCQQGGLVQEAEQEALWKELCTITKITQGSFGIGPKKNPSSSYSNSDLMLQVEKIPFCAFYVTLCTKILVNSTIKYLSRLSLKHF